ncbi:MAG TPA: hypothetical protein V6C88_11810 [Chroococcidiopsis sp.]
MLRQFQRLELKTDGRYATDSELQFLEDCIQTYDLRVQTYHTLKTAEMLIVQEVLAKVKAIDANLLRHENNDVTNKWKSDTLRVLRYSAIAMLVNDPDTLQERFLLWFQTIMRSFNAQRSCDITYEVMQQVVKRHLTPEQAGLFCPILELNRQCLGAKA